MTNLEVAFSPKDIVRAYQKRGTMENYIKEAKNGFKFDQMNSHFFQVNEVRMRLSLLAYNLTNWLRTLALPPEQKKMQIETIRTRLIKVASKLVKSGDPYTLNYLQVLSIKTSFGRCLAEFKDCR
ncbi:transposase [Staphylococcus xylosus]|uniref:transposase n=1 Tax=Staphylococcus xylosus TaxID=1288 RepID=UPI002DB86D55|nr:transposase [Staphylococcus xylosus]MEB8123099.1 transposase [Staphylococcus xylosus]